MFSQHCALLLYCNQILCFSYELACSTPKLKLSEPRYLLIIGNVNNHPLEHVLNWPHHYSNSVFCSHNLCARFKRNTQKLKFNHVTMHHTELAASRTRWLSYCKEDRAMRAIYGCPEVLRVLTTPWLLVQKFVMDFSSDRY